MVKKRKIIYPKIQKIVGIIYAAVNFFLIKIIVSIEAIIFISIFIDNKQLLLCKQINK